MPQIETASAPRPGLLAIVRSLGGLVVSVEPSVPDPVGVFHAVTVEYVDTDGPLEDTLIWEHEPRGRLAINELRETFHYWVRTLQLSIIHGRLRDPSPHLPKLAYPTSAISSREDIERARGIPDETEKEIGDLIKSMRRDLTAQLDELLTTERDAPEKREQDRFRSGRAELSTLIDQSTAQRLERERVLDRIVPKRYALHGEAHVVAVETCLPEREI